MDLAESRLAYREHTWTVYRPDRCETKPDLREDKARHVCDSSSRMAEIVAASSRRSYFDFELLAAGIDPMCGGHVGVLTKPWRGHRPGAVVMTVYERDDTDEWDVRITYCVADDVVSQP